MKVPGLPHSDPLLSTREPSSSSSSSSSPSTWAWWTDVWRQWSAVVRRRRWGTSRTPWTRVAIASTEARGNEGRETHWQWLLQRCLVSWEDVVVVIDDIEKEGEWHATKYYTVRPGRPSDACELEQDKNWALCYQSTPPVPPVLPPPIIIMRHYRTSPTNNPVLSC